MAKALTDRAKRRLRLLAGLLRTRGKKFDVPRDQFYEQAQRAASALSSSDRAELKSLVDWLESYEIAEEKLATSSPEPKRRALQAKPWSNAK